MTEQLKISNPDIECDFYKDGLCSYVKEDSISKICEDVQFVYKCPLINSKLVENNRFI